MEIVPLLNLAFEHLLPEEFEKLLQKRSSRSSLEEASEDEEKADEAAEPYQAPSSEPPDEEIQNYNGSVIQQTVLPDNGLGPLTPHSLRQSLRDATKKSTAVRHTRDEQVDHQSAMLNDRRSMPGKLDTESLTRLSSIEGMTRRLDTTSTADFPYVNSFAEEHHCVETAANRATPLAKQARRPDRRSRKKRYAKLKEEMKRLSRMQQIQKKASAAGDEKVVQILLKRGADVNAQGGKFGNALRAESADGHDKVLQMLLDKGADINCKVETQYDHEHSDGRTSLSVGRGKWGRNSGHTSAGAGRKAWKNRETQPDFRCQISQRIAIAPVSISSKSGYIIVDIRP